MRIFHYIFRNVFLLPAAFLLFSFAKYAYDDQDFVIQQEPLEGNNIRAWIINSGIFDSDFRAPAAPGFEWPIDSGKFAVYSAGLSIAALVNGHLRMAAASWMGEFAPGYIVDSAGTPVARTDNRFKIYSVKRTDNWINNPDWLNWGNLVPYGAPYVDVNNSGHYEYMTDTPGIRGAVQTVFCCLTDGFTETHSSGEGFGGGTLPMYAESHVTAWAYDLPGLRDVQFLKWAVINKNNSQWNNTFFTVLCDADVGYAVDDYAGSDTTRHLGFMYNCDSVDELGYGLCPPSFGIDLLKGAVNMNLSPSVEYGMSSLVTYTGSSNPGPTCEKDPTGDTQGAYWFMKGFKKDGTPWVIPNTSPPQTTKYCYSGDPETQTGWTEKSGSVWNCQSLYGNFISPDPCRDMRFALNSGSENLTVNPGDTQTVMIAQFIARGTNNLNSVTKLKQLDDFIQAFVDNGFVIGVNPVSNEVPNNYILYQNYPNPFNPSTKIKFEIPYGVKSEKSKVKMVIYDVLGREVKVLHDEQLSPGTYEVDWDASNYPSGVYFYRFITDDISITKKMVFLK
jgi:hypothetical protein